MLSALTAVIALDTSERRMRSYRWNQCGSSKWGHLSRLLQFSPTGSIDPTMPILMLAIIFGLSMDYEVFLLSRIRERYDQTGDNTAAVASACSAPAA
jgi:uncharacterized membrane protein YdfJ with MMPL/SSD domain